MTEKVIPPSLREVPNLNHKDMTLEALREEVDCWKQRLETAGPSTVGAYSKALRSAESWLEIRQNESAEPAHTVAEVDATTEMNNTNFGVIINSSELFMVNLQTESKSTDPTILWDNGRLVVREVTFKGGIAQKQELVDITKDVAAALLKEMFPAATANPSLTEVVPL